MTFRQSDSVKCYERVTAISYATRKIFYRASGKRVDLPKASNAYLLSKDVRNRTQTHKAIHRQLARLQETAVRLAAVQKRVLARNLRDGLFNRNAGTCNSTAEQRPEWFTEAQTSLKFQHLVSAFVTLAGGYALGAILLSLEWFAYYARAQYRRQHVRAKRCENVINLDLTALRKRENAKKKQPSACSSCTCAVRIWKAVKSDVVANSQVVKRNDSRIKTKQAKCNKCAHATSRFKNCI